MYSQSTCAALLAGLFLCGSVAVAESIEVRLTTKYRGPDQCLGGIGDGPDRTQAGLRPCAGSAAHPWTLTPLEQPGRFLLVAATGDQPRCLGLGGPDRLDPELAPCAATPDQTWRFSRDGDYHRVVSEALGPDFCLDVIGEGRRDGEADMRPCGDFTGQFWVVAPQPVWSPPTAGDGIEGLSGDPGFDEISARIEGIWVSTDDAAYQAMIMGGQFLEFYGPDLQGEHEVVWQRGCPGAPGSGPAMMLVDPEASGAAGRCLEVVDLTDRHLRLAPAGEAGTLDFIRGKL